MSKTAILVVTHNSERVIGACLDACARYSKALVLVVDNASEDATAAVVRSRTGVLLLANSHNRGFAAAVNQGMSALDAPNVLLLNPDAVLQTAIDLLVEACECGAAAAAGLLTDEAGHPQTGFSVRRLPTPWALTFEVMGLNRVWPGNPVNRRYRALDWHANEPAEVEQPAGAFLMLRRDVWGTLGGFDEQFYPVWFEDVDYCKRLRDHGLTIQFVPQVRALHEGGHSVSRLPWGCRQVYWYVSLLKYASKHFRASERRLVSAAVILGFVPRLVTGILSGRRAKTIKAFFAVVRFAVPLLLPRGNSGRISSDASPAAGQRVRR